MMMMMMMMMMIGKTIRQLASKLGNMNRRTHLRKEENGEIEGCGLAVVKPLPNEGDAGNQIFNPGAEALERREADFRPNLRQCIV